MTGETWTTVVELIRQAGVPELDGLLDRYYRKRFASEKTCWVNGARAFIVKRARALGVDCERRK